MFRPWSASDWKNWKLFAMSSQFWQWGWRKGVHQEGTFIFLIIYINFHYYHYQPAIQKLSFHLLHVKLLGAIHVGKIKRKYLEIRSHKNSLNVGDIMQRSQWHNFHLKSSYIILMIIIIYLSRVLYCNTTKRLLQKRSYQKYSWCINWRVSFIFIWWY